MSIIIHGESGVNIKNPGGGSFTQGLGIPIGQGPIAPLFLGQGTQIRYNEDKAFVEYYSTDDGGWRELAKLDDIDSRYFTIQSYADMLSVVNQEISTGNPKAYSFLVSIDENRSQTNTIYQFYPDRTIPANSVLRYIPSLDDIDNSIETANDYTDVQVQSINSGVKTITATDVPVPGIDIYRAYAAGTYTNFLDQSVTAIVITSGDIANGYADIVRQGAWFIKKPGVVNLSNYVNKTTDIVTITGKNLLDSTYIQVDKAINSLGAIVTSVGAKSFIDFPATPGQAYTISGIVASFGRYFAFANSGGTVLSVANLNPIPKTFTAPANTATIRIGLKAAADPDSVWQGITQLELGTVATAYEAPTKWIEKINTIGLAASKILPGNNTSDPVTANNAVNLRHFDANAVRVEDLEFTTPTNLANPVGVILDMFVNSTYGISAGVGWKMIRIPVDPGNILTVGRFTITSGGYGAFYSYDSGTNTYTLTGGGITINNANIPRTTGAAPSGSQYFLFDFARPGDSGNADQLTVNLGTSLLPYEDPNPKIEKIRDYEIAGGGSSDIESFSELNDVPPYLNNQGKGLKVKSTQDGLEIATFAEQNAAASFTSVTTNVLKLNNIPTGTTRPGSVAIGDAWLDTSVSATDPVLKVRIS